MNFLFDVCHPAHVHFFKNAIRILEDEGHKILITSRHKDCTTQLLDELGFDHRPISSLPDHASLWNFLKELCLRESRLYSIVRRFRPDCMTAIGGTFIAHVGKLTGIPSLAFYDTENARLQNLITYPFADRVIVPRCYESWVPEKKERRYPGYHELAYLHPDYFTPDKERAIRAGLDPDRPNFLCRMVSWQASHDLNETGWSREQLVDLVKKLEDFGNVIISSESVLPPELARCHYAGEKNDLHHLLSFCTAYIGESATVASEAAVLGVPAIYAARTPRGYTNEQEYRYGLVANCPELSVIAVMERLEDILGKTPGYWREARKTLLDDTVDVSRLICDTLLQYPRFPLPDRGKD